MLNSKNRAPFALLLLLLAVAGMSCRQQKPASAYEVWGVDVSRHQENLDWDRLVRDGKPHFVYLKATEGTLIQDPAYKEHCRQLDKHGVLRGAYHFFGHRTSGREQARNFIATAGLQKGHLYPVLDIEAHRFFKDPEKMVREVQAFCEEIRREYGVRPILYASSNFYRRYLQADFPASSHAIWIADYSNIPEIDWLLWQHTDNHRVAGHSRGIDRNVFAGRESDLEKLILK
jgi:lysozyme